MDSYLRRFGVALRRGATRWARDNIIFAGMMLVAPPILVYARAPKYPIDWVMIRTALWLYLSALTIYLIFHCLKTIRKLDDENIQTIAKLNAKLTTEVVITDLLDSDPRVEAEFVDERSLGDKSSSLLLTNRGVHAAHMVRVLPIKLKERTLIFPHIEEIIDPSATARFAPFVGRQWGYDSHSDLVRAMSEQWIKTRNSPDVRECVVPAKIDFEDDTGTRFEASFELLYHGGQGYNHPDRHKSIECQNFVYRRIPKGSNPSD
jgi:hypothetical protein